MKADDITSGDILWYKLKGKWRSVVVADRVDLVSGPVFKIRLPDDTYQFVKPHELHATAGRRI